MICCSKVKKKKKRDLGHWPVVDNNEDTKNFALCREQQKIVCNVLLLLHTRSREETDAHSADSFDEFYYHLKEC